MMDGMEDRATRPPRRPTRTSAFGAGRRESHDSSAFYARFHPPVIDDDDRIGPRPDVRGPILGDARSMDHIPDRSIALVVTSPPYFVGKEYEDAVLQSSRSNALSAELPETYKEYLQLLHDVLRRMPQDLGAGRCAWRVNVANLGRKPYRSLSADVIGILEESRTAAAGGDRLEKSQRRWEAPSRGALSNSLPIRCCATPPSGSS